MAAGYEDFPSTPFQAEEQPEAFVRVTRAEPEKEALILKAKAEADEEALILKAKAEADEEEASLKAKAEKEAALIVKAGCGSKRKAEEDHEESPAAVDVMVQWNGGGDDSEDEFYKACMADDSIDFDSDDGPDERYAKCKAWFGSRMEVCNARYPGTVAKGEVADADADADGSLLV